MSLHIFNKKLRLVYSWPAECEKQFIRSPEHFDFMELSGFRTQLFNSSYYL